MRQLNAGHVMKVIFVRNFYLFESCLDIKWDINLNYFALICGLLLNSIVHVEPWLLAG